MTARQTPKSNRARNTARNTAVSGKPAARNAAAPAAQASHVARILAAVRRVPRGKVSTYGDIASIAGLPRRARLVGTVLRQTPGSRGLPWFRIINASGRSSLPNGSDAQHRQWRLLEAEGIVVRNGRIDLRRYGWPPRARALDELLWKMA